MRSAIAARSGHRNRIARRSRVNTTQRPRSRGVDRRRRRDDGDLQIMRRMNARVFRYTRAWIDDARIGPNLLLDAISIADSERPLIVQRGQPSWTALSTSLRRRCRACLVDADHLLRTAVAHAGKTLLGSTWL